MKVTIVDVAKHANVSIATVSRVMNGNYPVSAKTRILVLKAIEELKFVPNMQAREIKIRKSKTIGVIVPSVENMFFPDVIRGIEQCLIKDSYSLLLSFSKNNKEREMDCIRNLMARNVAGIIIADVNTENLKNGEIKAVAGNTPVVFINGNPKYQEFSYVLSDEEQGARLALEHLWEHGHRRICFVRGKNSYSYEIKEKAFLEFMKHNQIDASENIYIVGDGNSSGIIEKTADIFKKILKEKRYTAAFCCNDLMGIGMMHACKSINRKVPKEFSVVGFDNIILASYTEPKLTTVDQETLQLGYNAAQLILENIDSDEMRNKRIILNTKLIKQGSVADKI